MRSGTTLHHAGLIPLLWQELGGYPLTPEYPFGRYRFDWAIPPARVALELEGGVWRRLGHAHPKRFESDCRKYNQAQLEGWVVFRFTPQMLAREGATLLLPIIAFVRSRLEAMSS